MGRFVAERFQMQEEVTAQEEANKHKLLIMQRKAHRESFVSMFRGVPCNMATGTAHELDCSNGDVLALLARECVIDDREYSHDLPWEQDIKDNVSLDVESIRWLGRVRPI